VTNDCSESLGTNTQTMKGGRGVEIGFWVGPSEDQACLTKWQIMELCRCKTKDEIRNLLHMDHFCKYTHFHFVFFFWEGGGGGVLWTVFSVHLFTDPNPNPNPRLFV
jgi:hypothetical protein